MNTLKKFLNDQNNSSAAATTTIRNKRIGHSPEFLQGVKERPWETGTPSAPELQRKQGWEKDFNSMAEKSTRNTLIKFKSCPTDDYSTWTEEMASDISSDCLYKILTKTKAPVKLGILWKQINCWAVFHFTDGMKSSFRNIDHGDFQFMEPDVLKFILLSVPDICSAIKLSFWTEDTIRHISTKCLYYILKEAKQPVKLGKLWQQIYWLVPHGFTKEMRASWQNIHHGDFYYMNHRILQIISSDQRICSALGLSFWTRETIKGISAQCLHILLKEARRSIKLGRLWEQIDRLVIQGFTNEMKPSWRNIDHDDFKWMKLDVMKVISLGINVETNLNGDNMETDDPRFGTNHIGLLFDKPSTNDQGQGQGLEHAPKPGLSKLPNKTE